MQQKIILVSSEEAAVLMAALNARRVFYKDARIACDNEDSAKLLGELERKAGNLFLKVANAAEAQPLPLRRVHPLWRLWRRMVRKEYARTMLAA